MKHLKTFEQFVNESQELNEKKITVITYGGKKTKYTDSDIKNFIKHIDLDADDLPGWLYRKGLDKYDNALFPKTRTQVTQLLNKILDNKGDVEINVRTDKPMDNTIIFESDTRSVDEMAVSSRTKHVIKDVFKSWLDTKRYLDTDESSAIKAALNVLELDDDKDLKDLLNRKK